jgi:hypothetical protein
MLKAVSVTAALKKTGLQKAEFHRSRQVRGWGEWTAGFNCAQSGTSVVVVWKPGVYRTPLAVQERLRVMAEACRAKGWQVIENGNSLTVEAAVAASGRAGGETEGVSDE